MKQIKKLDMRLITIIILTLLQFKIEIGQSYNNNDGQSHFWDHVNSNNNDVVQQNFQTKKHNHHHQESKDHGNSVGRWVQQPGRGCFWTGCMSKLHQHYCPAATFVHEVNPCSSPALHVDVMCCLSRSQEATQAKNVYMAYPPTITSTTTTTETPPPTITTATTTVKTTTTTTETPPTTGTRHHNHHQSKGDGNSFGRWAKQPGRGCFWTGCMSKLHQHYCPATTFVHEINLCPSPALHVDVMCCLSRPQEAIQSKAFDMYLPTTTSTTETPPPTTTTTTTTTPPTTTTETPPATTTEPSTITITETPPTTTTEYPTTTNTETPPTTTTEYPTTTNTETPPTTTTEYPTTTNTETPPTTTTTTETPPTTTSISSEAPPTTPDYDYVIEVTAKVHRK